MAEGALGAYRGRIGQQASCLTAPRVTRNQPQRQLLSRVRKILQAASQSLRRLTITGLPIGCDVFVWEPAARDSLKYVVGLACNGEAQPWVGRTSCGMGSLRLM